MSQQPKQEKDYFWQIIVGVIALVAVTLWLVKSQEHGKYVTSQQAIQQDKAFSAYR
ncbi:MAG: hypothetical protein N3A55_01230 [Methylohalobius sp.]|nr:hypothetical protein [Methylohalobius sp.]